MKIEIKKGNGATLINGSEVDMSIELGRREELTITHKNDLETVTLKLNHQELQKLRELLLKEDN